MARIACGLRNGTLAAVAIVLGLSNATASAAIITLDFDTEATGAICPPRR